MNLQKNKSTAVILINMGGPENLDEASSFMRKLFSDPHIMAIPWPFRAIVARLITLSRISSVKKHYQQIGGGSPLKKWTQIQAEFLKAELSKKHANISVTEAYSYSRPMIVDAIESLQDYDTIIAVPLYPHYSFATMGSIFSDIEKARNRYGLANKLKITPPFYKDPLYIETTVRLLHNALQKIDSKAPYRVIFTAHALPQSFIAKGDPYRLQVERTVQFILKSHPLSDWALSFQSKIGPVKWMKPSTIETVRKAGNDGIKQLAVMPIGFVCDHIETLYELDIELAAIAKASGIEKFIRGEVFNTDDTFIHLLASLVEQELP
jgi:ferrochelatase